MSVLHGQRRLARFDPEAYRDDLIPLLKKLEGMKDLSEAGFNRILKQFPKDGSGYFSKAHLIRAYRAFAGTNGLAAFNQAFVHTLKMKPVRTNSGVTPVTVLTKPFACPGKCIFCPNDVRMPKSYLSNEPGAQRAERNHFHPYLQTYNRLLAYREMGHTLSKAELIVLGGTWSCYPSYYKIWFITHLFAALNDFGNGVDRRSEMKPSLDVTKVQHVHEGLDKASSYNQAIAGLYQDQEQQKRALHQEIATWEELETQQQLNEKAMVRCVGLVLETRPDYISKQEVIDLRRMGCTKTQIGLQSLQDSVLALNKRGHDVAASRRAMRLLRQAGMKIHAHWMPNLYGSSVEADMEDFSLLFQDPDFCPDELKIYPCSLIEQTELMDVYKAGRWKPYTHDELLQVLSFAMSHTPSYCRLTRVVRDIPSEDIVAGNTLTNFRQISEAHANEQGIRMWDIRSREIRGQKVLLDDLSLTISGYRTSVADEYFLEFVTTDYQIVGFLRLSLPTTSSFIDELDQEAIIREIHVYGNTMDLGSSAVGRAQHLGLGKRLIARATLMAHEAGFTSLAVISAIGTREYYRKLGFEQGKLYQHLEIAKPTKNK